MKCEDCLYAERWHKNFPCNRCASNAYLTVRDYFKPKSPVETGTDWLPITSIPFDRYVQVKTITGLIRVGKPRGASKGGPRWIKRADGRGPARIQCWGKPTSDLWAIAWREL